LQIQEELGHYIFQLDEDFKSIRSVKSFLMEEQEISKAQSKLAKILDLYKKSIKYNALVMPITELFNGLAMCFITIYGGILIFEGKTIAEREKQRYDEVSPINLLGGKLWSCNFAIQKKLFFTLNGFDENYPFSTMEDIDFKERAKLVSNFHFINDSIVVHPWRKRIAFKNFKLRIQSQRYFAEKFNQKNTFQFRIKRIKIFTGSLFSNFKELAQFKFKGWLCYIDKMVFNFIMIFI
jgi:ABC-type multidrug transport system fused ATPase/permease subunit